MYDEYTIYLYTYKQETSRLPLRMPKILMRLKRVSGHDDGQDVGAARGSRKAARGFPITAAPALAGGGRWRHLFVEKIVIFG